MGRGGNTNQTGVRRHQPSYSSDPIAVGGGSGPAPEMAAGCLFSFTEEMTLDGPSAAGASAGIAVTMMRSALPGELLIKADNGARLGEYAGDYVTQMLRCMRKKYVYRGVVESVGAINSSGARSAVISIQGLGQL